MLVTHRAKKLAATVMLLATASQAAPAYAQGIPVIDPQSIAQMVSMVANAAQQLAQLQASLKALTNINNILGQVGGNSLQSNLGTAGLTFTGTSSPLKDVNSLSSNQSNLSTTLSQYTISGETLQIPTVNSFASGQNAAQQIFYYGGTGAMQQSQIDGLNTRRSAALRYSAMNGYALASSLKGDLTTAQGTAATLASQSQNATDVRTDIQANTAVLLAIYSESVKQTSLLAQQLELESSNTMATDPTGTASSSSSTSGSASSSATSAASAATSGN